MRLLSIFLFLFECSLPKDFTENAYKLPCQYKTLHVDGHLSLEKSIAGECKNCSYQRTKRLCEDSRTLFVENLEPADIEEYPFAVTIWIKQDPRSYLCSGSLVTARHVLTAGHHVAVNAGSRGQVRLEPTFLVVRAGTSKIKESESSSYEEIGVSFVSVHPGLKRIGKRWNNDLAIIGLTDKVKLSNKVSLIKLASNDDFLVLSDTSNHGNGSCNTLRWVRKELSKPQNTSISEAFRFQMMGSKWRSEKEFIWTMEAVPVNVSFSPDCIKSAELFNRKVELLTVSNIRSGTCQEDSGGPLVCQDKQYGILSTLHCKIDIQIDFYTRADSFIDWILNEVMFGKYKSVSEFSRSANAGNFPPLIFALILLVPIIIS